MQGHFHFISLRHKVENLLVCAPFYLHCHFISWNETIAHELGLGRSNWVHGRMKGWASLIEKRFTDEDTNQAKLMKVSTNLRCN